MSVGGLELGFRSGYILVRDHSRLTFVQSLISCDGEVHEISLTPCLIHLGYLSPDLEIELIDFLGVIVVHTFEGGDRQIDFSAIFRKLIV